MSGRCYIHTFEPLCLLGIHSQPHSWLDLASVDHHIWPYSLPNSLYISPDWPQKKGCFYKHCPNPLCSGTRTSGSALSISPPHPCLLVISAEIWGGLVGSLCKSRCPTLRNPLAQGSSLEEDTGWGVAVYTCPVATGM